MPEQKKSGTAFGCAENMPDHSGKTAFRAFRDFGKFWAGGTCRAFLSAGYQAGGWTQQPDSGDNCTIAANAVLLKPLQDNVTAVGVPARAVKIDGVPIPKKEKNLVTMDHYCKMEERIRQMEETIASLQEELASVREKENAE